MAARRPQDTLAYPRARPVRSTPIAAAAYLPQPLDLGGCPRWIAANPIGRCANAESASRQKEPRHFSAGAVRDRGWQDQYRKLRWMRNIAPKIFWLSIV